MSRFVRCVKCGNVFSISTTGYKLRTYNCTECGCTFHKFCLDEESIKKVIRELISELEQKHFPKGEITEIEERYLKRIEEECYFDWFNKKEEPDKDGGYHNLNDEKNYMNADEILRDLLKELGYTKLVKKYNSIDKYYS